MPTDPILRITVLYSPSARVVHECRLGLAKGATVRQAVDATGWPGILAGVDARTLALGVWGRKANGTRLLRDGDRVEVYRALAVDPKAARRERFRMQGVRAAGLFARKKAAAEPTG